MNERPLTQQYGLITRSVMSSRIVRIDFSSGARGQRVNIVGIIKPRNLFSFFGETYSVFSIDFTKYTKPILHLCLCLIALLHRLR